jgi:hypothetical protein
MGALDDFDREFEDGLNSLTARVELKRAFDAASEALRKAIGPKAKWLALRNGVEDLKRKGDDGTKIDHLRNIARTYGMGVADIRSIIDQNFEDPPHAQEGDQAGGDRGEPHTEAKDSFIAFWHGEVVVDGSRPWLVRGTIPEVGCGLLPGQWVPTKPSWRMISPSPS